MKAVMSDKLKAVLRNAELREALREALHETTATTVSGGSHSSDAEIRSSGSTDSMVVTKVLVSG